MPKPVSSKRRNKFSFAIQDENGRCAKDSVLREGDLVGVFKKSSNDDDNDDYFFDKFPEIGILVGSVDTKDGLALSILTQAIPVSDAECTSRIWRHKVVIMVCDISFVQLLARGGVVSEYSPQRYW